MQNAQEICDSIKGLGKLINYKEGEAIYVPCSRGRAIYFISKGKVKISHLDRSGRRLTLAILKAGDLFGEFFSGHRELEARALEDSVLLAIDGRRFLHFAKTRPEALLKLMWLLLRRIQRAQQKLKDLAFKDIETSLARTFLRLSQEYGYNTPDGIEISLKLTHQELSELVGSTRESVTLALKCLEREGLLDKRGFSVIIKDEAGLKRRAALIASPCAQRPNAIKYNEQPKV